MPVREASSRTHRQPHPLARAARRCVSINDLGGSKQTMEALDVVTQIAQVAQFTIERLQLVMQVRSAYPGGRHRRVRCLCSTLGIHSERSSTGRRVDVDQGRSKGSAPRLARRRSRIRAPRPRAQPPLWIVVQHDNSGHHAATDRRRTQTDMNIASGIHDQGLLDTPTRAQLQPRARRSARGVRAELHPKQSRTTRPPPGEGAIETAAPRRMATSAAGRVEVIYEVLEPWPGGVGVAWRWGGLVRPVHAAPASDG